MKQFKRLCSLLLALTCMLSLAMVPAFAAGSLQGDCNVFLPASGTVKVQYQLLNDSGSAVSNASYAITGPEGWQSYAWMDASTGALYVSSDAPKGVALQLSATADGVSASQSVTLQAGYDIDFEDADAAAALFGESVRDLIKKDDKGNHYGDGTSPTWGNNGQIKFSPTDLATSRLTVEGQFISNGTSTGTGSDNMPIQVAYNSVSFTGSSGTQTFAPTFGLLTLNSGLAGTTYYYKSGDSQVQTNRVSTVGLSYVPGGVTDFKWVIKNGGDRSKSTLTINNTGSTTMTDYQMFQSDPILLDTVNVKQFIFAAPVDNLKIYSGEKVTGSYEIDGVDTVYRAMPGTTAKFPLSARAILPWGEATGLTWQIKDNPAGVSIDSSGLLKVSGSAAADFTVQLCSGATVVGEKTIAIAQDYYGWVDVDGYAYLDFEGDQYVAGEVVPFRAIGEANWNDYVLSAEPQERTNYPKATIKQEAGGNKYVSAVGRTNWSQDGATMRVGASVTSKSFALQGCSTGTISMDAMVESASYEAYNPTNEWSVLTMMPTYNGADTTRTLDIRYRRLSDNTVGIYNYIDKTTGAVNGDPELIAVVPVDTWFNVRVEADFTANKTYDLYINDVKVLENAKHNMDYVAYMFIGIGFDNLQYYNGSKDAVIRTGFNLLVNGAAASVPALGSDTIALGEAGTKTIAVSLSDGEHYATGKLIAAVYAGGKLIGVTSAPVAGGMGCTNALTIRDVPADATAKVFVWNMDTLQPLR